MKRPFRRRVMEWRQRLLALDDQALANFLNWRLDTLWDEWASEEFENSFFYAMAKCFCLFQLDEPSDEGRVIERSHFALKPIAEIRAWLRQADAKRIHASLLVCLNPGSPFPEFPHPRILERLAYYPGGPNVDAERSCCPRCSSDDFDWDETSLSFVCEDCAFHFVHPDHATPPCSRMSHAEETHLPHRPTPRHAAPPESSD